MGAKTSKNRYVDVIYVRFTKNGVNHQFKDVVVGLSMAPLCHFDTSFRSVLHLAREHKAEKITISGDEAYTSDAEATIRTIIVEGGQKMGKDGPFKFYLEFMDMSNIDALEEFLKEIAPGSTFERVKLTESCYK